MNKGWSILICFGIILCASGCGGKMAQQPSPGSITPLKVTQTATNTPTATITRAPWPSTTRRPTSTTRPLTVKHPTLTPEPPVTSNTPQTASSPNDVVVINYGKIAVVGKKKFLDQTSLALNLLQNQSPDAYRKIEKYVGVIEQGEHSAMWAWETPPRYEVGDRTANYSTTWYASTIAHDATHSQLYHEFLAAHGEPVPEDTWASVTAEQFCIAYQLVVLKEIDAPTSEIEYLETQTGTHCDVDNDGDCDWADYDARDW